MHLPMHGYASHHAAFQGERRTSSHEIDAPVPHGTFFVSGGRPGPADRFMTPHPGQVQHKPRVPRARRRLILTFSELNLIAPILKAVAEEGYEIPTPIQEQAIPLLLEGRDLVGCV